MKEFQGKAVFITGAGRGVGKRLAIGFAAAGAKIGLVARSKAELDLTKLEIEHAGGTALHLRADVRDPESIRSAVERMRAHFGDIYTLICAAGLQGPVGPFLENPPAAWHETIATNLNGIVNTVAAVLPEMVRRRSGKIVAITGGGGSKIRPNFTAYATSKAAIIRFVECLAEEVRSSNVQVNCLSPGGAYTHMTDEILKAGDKAGEKEIADAIEVRMTGGVPAAKQVELAMFLSSERSNHVSGKILHVQDDWRKLENSSVHPELYTLRRVMKV
jgi:3-oxoacyl-[acyl-carrier protein] reductase